jgi:hypothetical protein
MQFAVHPSGGASSLAVAAVTVPRAQLVEVPTDTVDHICRVHRLRPDVIKIDVEGAELDVLRGARETLTDRRVHAFVEFHPSVWPSIGVSRADVERQLSSQGFEAEPLDPSFDIWTDEGMTVRLRRR